MAPGAREPSCSAIDVSEVDVSVVECPGMNGKFVPAWAVDSAGADLGEPVVPVRCGSGISDTCVSKVGECVVVVASKGVLVI